MDKHRRQLDASVGASGPPGFAVCNNLTRLLKLRHPPHPAPNVRDDGETPLVRVRDNCRSIAVSSKRKSEIFFRGGLDKTGKSGRRAFTSSVMIARLNACDVVQR
jgi:hypothetical protein